MSSNANLEIDPGLRPEILAEAFGQRNRIRIPHFLAPQSADALRSYLQGSQDWRHIIKGEKNIFETSSSQMDAMEPPALQSLEEAIFREAANGFRFRYDSIRIPDDFEQRRQIATPLARFAELMSSPPLLNFFRHVTGNSEICFVDAQATRYRRGDFLTRHDDTVGGKDRSHAFVLGLTSEWRPDWGGLLLFNEPNSDLAHAYAPAFNSLDLFTIGQPHSVSYVAPFAASVRISITGWLRTRLP